MFENLEKALESLLKKKLSSVGSYVPNGELYYIEKDAENECMTIQFSLLLESEFNELLANVEKCVKSYNLNCKKKNYMNGFVNAVTLNIYK